MPKARKRIAKGAGPGRRLCCVAAYADESLLELCRYCAIAPHYVSKRAGRGAQRRDVQGVFHDVSEAQRLREAGANLNGWHGQSSLHMQMVKGMPAFCEPFLNPFIEQFK
jgi:hypothetical protein